MATKKRVDPIRSAVDQNRLDSSFFITLAARFVSYHSFFEDCGVDEFRQLLGLVVYDAFSVLDEEQKARKLGVRPVEKLKALRTQLGRTSGDCVYEQIRGRLLGKAKELSLPKTLDQWAEELEDIAARDLAHLAIVAPSARERIQANREFLDRRSAKIGRDVPPTVLILPERLSAELEAGFRFLTENRLAGEIDGEIDAGRLNVPRLVGSGETGAAATKDKPRG